VEIKKYEGELSFNFERKQLEADCWREFIELKRLKYINYIQSCRLLDIENTIKQLKE
jgi:hypothetical protein